MTTSITTPVLVVGGTGSIGRLVVARLVELGLTPRVLTRHPERARASLPDATEVVAGDIADAASLASAAKGVGAAILTHGAPYGSGDYEAVDYGAVPAVLHALTDRSLPVVLMSSIGVTGTEGSAQTLLSWKRRGERVLRASGHPHTIVRPGWFDAGSGSEQRADLRQGDAVGYGPVRREHVAETLVQAVLSPAAAGRTLELFSADGDPVTDWNAAFAALDPDPEPNPGLDGAHDPATLPIADEPPAVRAELDRWR